MASQIPGRGNLPKRNKDNNVAYIYISGLLRNGTPLQILLSAKISYDQIPMCLRWDEACNKADVHSYNELKMWKPQKIDVFHNEYTVCTLLDNMTKQSYSIDFAVISRKYL